MSEQGVFIDIDNMTVDDLIVRKLKRALIKARGNVTDAAKMCGISRSTATDWIRRSAKLQNTLNEIRERRRNGEI